MSIVECTRRTFVEFTLPTRVYSTDVADSAHELKVVEVADRETRSLAIPRGTSTFRFFERYASDPFEVDGEEVQCLSPVIESSCSPRYMFAAQEIDLVELREAGQSGGGLDPQTLDLAPPDAHHLMARAQSIQGCNRVVRTSPSGFWVAWKEGDVLLTHDPVVV